MASADVMIASAPLGSGGRGPLPQGRGAECAAGEGRWLLLSRSGCQHGTLPGTPVQPWNRVARAPQLQLWVRPGSPEGVTLAVGGSRGLARRLLAGMQRLCFSSQNPSALLPASQPRTRARARGRFEEASLPGSGSGGRQGAPAPAGSRHPGDPGQVCGGPCPKWGRF